MLANNVTRSSRKPLSKKMQRIIELQVKAICKLKKQLEELKQGPARNHNDTYSSFIKEIEEVLEQIHVGKLESVLADSDPFLACSRIAQEHAISLNEIANSHGITTNFLITIRDTIGNIDRSILACEWEILNEEDEERNKVTGPRPRFNT